MLKVTVAIPTFRRPKSLAVLLSALEKLETTAAVSVLVADNDAEKHEGFDLCERLQVSGFRWPLRSIVVAERGIAAVRNALTDRALAQPCDFIAMLDDDEWPEASWLDAFLKVQAETKADLLQGSILFERAQDGWAAHGEGTKDIRRATGPTDMLQGAGNLLIARASFDDLTKPYFDPSFGLGGGEDLDFFMRLARGGRRFAWADEAVARSSVPAGRMRFTWALARAYSVGNSDMRVFLKHAPGSFAVAREVLKIGGALLLSPVMLVILGWLPNRAADALRKFCRAAGKTAAIFGVRYNEYAVTHGE